MKIYLACIILNINFHVFNYNLKHFLIPREMTSELLTKWEKTQVKNIGLYLNCTLNAIDTSINS